MHLKKIRTPRDGFPYLIFEALTLCPSSSEKEDLHLQYSLHSETTFFQASAKQFFATELKKLPKNIKKSPTWIFSWSKNYNNDRENPDLLDRLH